MSALRTEVISWAFCFAKRLDTAIVQSHTEIVRNVETEFDCNGCRRCAQHLQGQSCRMRCHRAHLTQSRRRSPTENTLVTFSSSMYVQIAYSPIRCPSPFSS